MGYLPSYADPDVYLRPAVKKNGDKYYEYVVTYVDGILIISENVKATMEGIKRKFTLKRDKYGPPSDYLGAVMDMLDTVLRQILL